MRKEDNYALTETTDELLEKMRTIMKYFTDFASECLDEEDDEFKTVMKDYEEMYHLMENYMMVSSLRLDTILIELYEIKKKLN